MTRKRRRLVFIGAAMLALSAAIALVLVAFEDSIVFFYTPSDLAAQPPSARAFRLGGLVEERSVKRLPDGATVEFRVTDLTSSIPVTYRGILPDLFREGQGVVAEGSLGADGIFVAREVLAKHDENYMPREVADALRKSGQWQGEESTQ